MFMRPFWEDVMFMRTLGRYVHEDIMTHQISTICLCGRYVHEVVRDNFL